MYVNNRLIFLNVFTILCIALSLASCKNNKGQTQVNKWEDTRWYKLNQENIRLRIPNQFKASSRYRIEKDLPLLAEDSIKLRLFQDQLEALEFKDAEVDVLVDTTTSFRVIIICNTSWIDFNKSNLAVLKRQIRLQNEEFEYYNPELEFGEVSVLMKGNSRLKMAEISFTLKNNLEEDTTSNINYYLSGDSYSLIVFEITANEKSIEKYLWTCERS